MFQKSQPKGNLTGITSVGEHEKRGGSQAAWAEMINETLWMCVKCWYAPDFMMKLQLPLTHTVCDMLFSLLLLNLHVFYWLFSIRTLSCVMHRTLVFDIHPLAVCLNQWFPTREPGPNWSYSKLTRRPQDYLIFSNKTNQSLIVISYWNLLPQELPMILCK